MIVLELSLVVWLSTAIVVESELCRPVREAVARRWPGKPAYLVSCSLCTGTWIGLALAAATPYRPIRSTLPLGAWILAGLLYKAVAHLTLILSNTVKGLTHA